MATGVYMLLDSGIPYYVGQSVNVNQRVRMGHVCTARRLGNKSRYAYDRKTFALLKAGQLSYAYYDVSALPLSGYIDDKLRDVETFLQRKYSATALSTLSAGRKLSAERFAEIEQALQTAELKVAVIGVHEDFGGWISHTQIKQPFDFVDAMHFGAGIPDDEPVGFLS